MRPPCSLSGGAFQGMHLPACRCKTRPAASRHVLLLLLESTSRQRLLGGAEVWRTGCERARHAQVNKGMIKMYQVEVLSKFPIMQHFIFCRLFGHF